MNSYISYYNQYKILSCKNKDKYIIIFKNIQNVSFSIAVTEKIYYAFNKFKLENKSQMNKYDRHIEHSQITEIALNKRPINKEITVEDIVISNLEKEKIHNAISKLPEIQRGDFIEN